MDARTNTRLFVMLGDKCNFKCVHCMVSASPRSSRFRISEDEIEKLSRTVDTDDSISVVHFTGGEPSLFIDQIEAFQKRVQRTVKWSMTTNGSFSDQAASVLSRIHLDEIVISFDSYHSEFIDKQKIQKLIDTAKSHAIETSLHAVYEDITDVSICEGITGVKPVLSRLGAIGRGRSLPGAKSGKNKNGLHAFCPGSTPTEERYLFVPDKGFTSCCGSLVWDELISGNELYADALGGENTVPEKIKGKTFLSIFESLGISVPDGGSFETPCDACEFLFRDRPEEGLPSISKIAGCSHYPATFPCSSILAEDAAECLSRRFMLKYVFKGDTINPTFEVNEDSELILHNNKIDISDTPPTSRSPLQFFEESFINKNLIHLNQVEIDSQLSQFEVVMSGPWKKQYYIRNDKIVGMFFAGEVDGRVIPETSTFHLLFFGYDRDAVSAIEAKEIRSHVISSIRTWNTAKLPITAISHAFNHPSLAFEEKIGLKPILLRVSENSHEI